MNSLAKIVIVFLVLLILVVLYYNSLQFTKTNIIVNESIPEQQQPLTVNMINTPIVNNETRDDEGPEIIESFRRRGSRSVGRRPSGRSRSRIGRRSVSRYGGLSRYRRHPLTFRRFPRTFSSRRYWGSDFNPFISGYNVNPWINNNLTCHDYSVSQCINNAFPAKCYQNYIDRCNDGTLFVR